MEGDYFVKLTLAVYRVTDFFPEKEPLKLQIRDLADRVLADLILTNPGHGVDKRRLAGNLKILNGYFEVASFQEWVDSRNFLVLKAEYDKIQKKLAEAPDLASMTRFSLRNPKPSQEINQAGIKEGRQKNILEILREKERVQIVDLKQFFPKVSKRTLRRDMNSLVRQGLIARIGEKNNTNYSISNK